MDEGGNFVRVNDIDIYYETYGEGSPLLLLHGGFAPNAYLQWMDHIETYARHFQVYTLDARAHGKTRNPSGILTTD